MKPGLCESCKHVKTLTSSRGSVFYMCQLAETNPRFSRYPPLPVLKCKGYEAQAETPPPAQK
jgi:hypothetical protein